MNEVERNEFFTLLTDRVAGARKIAVIGIGQVLAGDDAAGVAVVQALRTRVPESDWLMLVDAGPMPENFSGPLRRFRPNLVIMIDSALLGLSAGSARLFEAEQIDSLAVSTHSLPMNVFARYLEQETGCQTVFLGIQPQANQFDTPLSEPVQQTITWLVGVFSTILKANRAGS